MYAIRISKDKFLDAHYVSKVYRMSDGEIWDYNITCVALSNSYYKVKRYSTAKKVLSGLTKLTNVDKFTIEEV